MKPVDEAAYQQHLAELEADGEVGQAFRRLSEALAGRAEALIDNGAAPMDAVNEALPLVEAELGRVLTGYLGEVLMALSVFWHHGEQMVAGMTQTELHLVQDTVALKVAAMAKEAIQPTEKETSS
jgi:hypothetical protein